MKKTNKKVKPEPKRIRYTKEFKLEAVRALELGQKPASQLAMELGIARNHSTSGKSSSREEKGTDWDPQGQMRN